MKLSVFIILCLAAFGIGFLGIRQMAPSCADGQELFKTKCGKCHSPAGGAPIFGPVKYASVQWKRFFKRNKHQRKKDIRNEITQEELALIAQYLIDHAADSDRPIAAGLK